MHSTHAVTLALAFVVVTPFAVPGALAQISVGAPSGPVSSASAAESVVAKIEAQVAAVQALIDRCKLLQAQIEATQKEKPQPPQKPTSDSADAKAKYESDMAAFQKKLAAWQTKLDALNRALSDAKDKLAKEQAKLDALESELSAAQKKDQAVAASAKVDGGTAAPTAAEQRRVAALAAAARMRAAVKVVLAGYKPNKPSITTVSSTIPK